MELFNAMMPTPEQVAYLQQSDDPSPMIAINLLKFRPKAIYPDGRATDLSGLDAFMIYSEAMKGIVEGFGGRFIISALIDRMIIGSGDLDWDRIGLVEYPSRKVFAQVMMAPQVREAAIHRHAGLEGQLNIAARLQTDHRAG